MNRKEITNFLGELLKKDRLTGLGKHWSSEVSIDPFTTKGRRVDFIEFIPENQCSLSGIEKGIFVCYEVKSCEKDVYSGNGLNFYGEKNYIVTTIDCYKNLLPDLKKSIFSRHVKKCISDWTLKIAESCRQGPRKRSMTELLFCMLRSGR